jgi:large subunit ribosomal protein L21
MYAVIQSGGKQYRVAPGDTVRVEKLAGKVGSKVTFDQVLAVHTDDKKVVAGADAAKATVTGRIVAEVKGPKLTVLKYKRTNQYKIQRGHRQHYTAVEVSEIKL